MKRAILIAVLFVGVVSAAEPVKAPVLTDVQQLQLRGALQRMRIAQLELQIAQSEAAAIMKALEVKGYVLDLNRFVYVPVKAEPPQGEPNK